MNALDPGRHSGFARKVVDIHGTAGVAWQECLPSRTADCAKHWSLTVLPPFENLSYNYVAPAIRADGTPVVLKAGVPHPELFGEIAALRYFDGEGSVRLLDAVSDQGVMLLERLLPGTPLSNVEDDEQVTQIAAGVMQTLWIPAPAGCSFATVERWASGLQRLRACFDGGYGPFPPRLVDKAEGLFAELVGSDGAPSLINGDMHPGNILRSERSPWLAIDPKGVVGDRPFDAATFVCSIPRQPMESEMKGALKRRVDQLAELLGFERERLFGWALAQAVLSGWWSYEDHGRGWEEAFATAETIASILDQTAHRDMG
jgi:streptomycin 6-kinase